MHITINVELFIVTLLTIIVVGFLAWLIIPPKCPKCKIRMKSWAARDFCGYYCEKCRKDC